MRRLLFLAWFFAACAQAQPPATAVDPMPDYPAGSINSVDRADAALAAAARARALEEKRHGAQFKACYRKFFAESCLVEAREDNYQAMRRISGVEQEARDFHRRNDAAIAEKRRADKRAQEQADAPHLQAERDKKRAGQESKVDRNAHEAVQFQAQAGERAQRAAATAKRERDRDAELARKQAEERTKAPERVEQAREHEATVAEVLKHAQEREARQREKEKERQQKAATGPPKVAPHLEKGDDPS